MKFPRSLYNWVSITGLILAANAIILILILLLLSLITTQSNTYLGVYLYVILPAVLILGLILTLIGMISKRKRIAEPGTRWPVLDLNNKKQRDSVILISVFTFLFLIVSAVGSFQAFHYTESVDFCGKFCHRVMKPEHTTYLHSPHARVKCVECHVGEGADWYVKSKLSGLYQVYATVFNKYPRPIETPIRNLRPARETCERCHWPQKFYARTLRSQKGYLTDSLNTEWDIMMMMKIGPTYSALGLMEGIHWHINPDVRIEYVAATPDRESIPWVRFTNIKTGIVQVFQDTENVITPQALDSMEIRSMDCMDCHNRPSHAYKSAPIFVDNAMLTGAVPGELPFIKKVAMNVLKGPFTSVDTSLAYINDSILNFYRTGFPDTYNSKKDLIDKAIAGIKEAFLLNIFPEMRVTSGVYLNHIGHLESDGCFRCHSNRHKSDKGVVVSKDCDLCHTIIAQGPADSMQFASINKSLEFRHPRDIKDAWKEYFCTECHRSLYP
jgi:hypothetical protein